MRRRRYYKTEMTQLQSTRSQHFRNKSIAKQSKRPFGKSVTFGNPNPPPQWIFYLYFNIHCLALLHVFAKGNLVIELKGPGCVKRGEKFIRSLLTGP